MAIRPWTLPSVIFGTALLALISALAQIQGLTTIAVAAPVSMATRIFAQTALFTPLLLFILLSGTAQSRTGRIIQALQFSLLCFAVIYPHFPSPFFDYVWDVFLIESIFVYLVSQSLAHMSYFAKFQTWPLRLLLFKLMFCMGIVKFMHGMPEWRDFTAMKYFWANQPMPGFLAWHAAQLPDWIQRVMTFYVLIVEIPGPFLIFAGRRARTVFFWMNALLQFGIFFSGNYGFFNLLTIGVSLSLLDNEQISPNEHSAWNSKSLFVRITRAVVLAVSLGWAATTTWYIGKCIWPGDKYLHETSWIFLRNEVQQQMFAPMRGTLKLYAAAKVSNPYALFGMIPKYRMEVLIEGSSDGKEWKQYAFKVRPEEKNRAPVWYAPHHWRLDHQMYYESFRIRDTAMHEQFSFFLGVRWMPNLTGKLLEGDRRVTGILAVNPFTDRPPGYLRFRYLYYQFTTYQERRQSGSYWKTEPPHSGQFNEQPITRENYRQFP